MKTQRLPRRPPIHSHHSFIFADEGFVTPGALNAFVLMSKYGQVQQYSISNNVYLKIDVNLLSTTWSKLWTNTPATRKLAIYLLLFAFTILVKHYRYWERFIKINRGNLRNISLIINCCEQNFINICMFYAVLQVVYEVL